MHMLIMRKSLSYLIQLSYLFYKHLLTLRICLQHHFSYLTFSFILPWFAPFKNNEFLSIRFQALSKDALNSSHPVSANVTAPEEVEEMFDSVSYEKVTYSEHISSCVIQAPS